MRHIVTFTSLLALGLIPVSGLLAGCDDETTAATASASTTGGSGGTAGGSTTSSGGGGAGGIGGSGGMGPTVECLGESVHEVVFTLYATDVCVVGKYTADVEVGTDANFHTASPTWGRHGGLVFARPGAMEASKITITRLTQPSEATGAMTRQDTTVSLNKGSGFFLGGQVVDLPDTKWTFATYTKLDNSGEAIALDGTSIAKEYAMVGLFSMAAFAEGDKQRLLYTGGTPFEEGDPNKSTNGLYAADFCSGPALCSGGAVAIDTWGIASGVVAIDQVGNVFATQLTMNNSQEMRAFVADAMKPGGGKVAGEVIFDLPGYAGAIAATAPTAKDDGYVYFQPRDPNFAPASVLFQRYSIDGALVIPQGPAVEGITPAQAGTEVTLTTDEKGWLWLGIVTAMGETTFYVIAPKPKG